MPVKTDRIIPGIYCHYWQGHVTEAEIRSSFQRENNLAQADNYRQYIIILEGSEVRTYPPDIMNLRGVLSRNKLAILVTKAPIIGHKPGELISAAVKIPVELTHDWNETLIRAVQLLEENNSTAFPPEYA